MTAGNYNYTVSFTVQMEQLGRVEPYIVDDNRDGARISYISVKAQNNVFRDDLRPITRR